MGNEEEERKHLQVNEEIPQEEQQPGPSRKCNNLTESSNDESSDKEDCNLQNLQDPLDRTDREMWKLGSMRYMRWIYLPKALWQEIFLQMMIFFLCFISTWLFNSSRKTCLSDSHQIFTTNVSTSFVQCQSHLKHEELVPYSTWLQDYNIDLNFYL